jgi:hypothetical protein
MLRSSLLCLPIASTSYRGRQLCLFLRPPRIDFEAGRFLSGNSGAVRRRRRALPSESDERNLLMLPTPTTLFHRLFSTGDDINGNSSSSGRRIAGIESANATTQWKRSQYSKLEAKFQQPLCGIPSTITTTNHHTGDTNNTIPVSHPTEPLIIDNYEDVQPMWKGMESRVTKRAALTLEQRGGVSGRRNVRKSEEDMWLESGLYDTDKSEK